MAKKTPEQSTADIKKALENKKLVIGTDRTLKLIRSGGATCVYITSNCPDDVRDDIEKYGSVTIVQLPYPNVELGAICKKPFSISVVAVK